MGPSASSSVVLHGGMGNQLFQWAYGHHLGKNGPKVAFIFYDKPYLLDHTRESLEKYIGNCDHGDFLRVNLSKNRVIRALQDPTHPRNPRARFNKALNSTLDDPFNFSKDKSELKIYFGYYQNASMVHELADVLIPELLRNLDNEGLSERERELIGAEVVHIRQGDTMTPKNVERVGVLDSSYYANLPKKKFGLRVVVTDDVVGAKALLAGQDIDAFYGPEDLDVKKSLRVMSRASVLFTANSTLSWWGGVLAQNRGGEVYIPEPFFRNVDPAPLETFHFPGFRKLTSTFLNPESKLVLP